MFKRKDPAQLAAQLAELKGSKSFDNNDGNEWKLATDTAGNGTAVIRFLPGKTEEDAPFVKLINHGFKKSGKWYIENCTSTHGDYESCPVCKYLSDNDLYNTNKAEYDLVKRKTSYWANILVIKDPSHPENEGKVFKYRFGQKIMDKINAMVEVDTSIGEAPVDIACLYDGANFVLKVKKSGGFTNYDECKFQTPAALPKASDEEFHKQLAEGMFDLKAMIAKDQFKEFDKLEATFKKIMGTSAAGAAASEAAKQADAMADELDSFEAEMSSFESSAEKSPEPQQQQTSQKTEIDDLLNNL